MELVSSAELTFAYDGESLRTGVMDVQELAPALLATGTLLQKANKLVNGEHTHVSLKVKSDFKRGSFLVNLVVDQSLLEQVKNFLLLHPGIKDSKDILELVFFYAGIPLSFFKLIKILGDKKPDSVTFENNGDNVNIVLGDQRIVVNKNTYNLYLDGDARRAASQIVAPLNTQGIEKLEIKRGDEIETVTKEQATAFAYTDTESEQLIDSVADAWLSIISLSFNPEHKWRFSNGGATITASVEDKAFWENVHKQSIKFSEGDQLLVKLRTKTSREANGQLHSRYIIEHVIQHVPSPKQARLEF